MFESMSDYRKIVLLIFLIQNDKDLLEEIGFSKYDIDYLYKKFKNILLEQHEEYFDYVKDQGESILEGIINK